jgi:starch-binding outer membrane protein, SusD/RagB family
MKQIKYNFLSLKSHSFQNISLSLYLKSFTFLLTLSLVSLSSCTKFLTEDLKGSFSTETYYQNQTQAVQAINGVYNAISFTNSSNDIWVFGDVASDDAVKGGNPGDQAEITYIDEFTADANNGIIYNYWKFEYEGITRANNVIANVPAVPMDDVLKSRIIGEAKFIRAYNYFNLVNTFGKVPLKLLPPVTQDAINVPLSDVTAIYLQIEKDLTEAVAVLPVSYASNEKGRITQGAALAMLGKVSLYQEKWADALSYFHQVENLGIYGLLPAFADNFKIAFENSKESIFEIQHLAAQNPGEGSGLNQWFGPAPRGYYFNAPTQLLVDAFEKTNTGEVDPRLDASLGRDGQPWFDGETYSSTWSPATGYLTKKHLQPNSELPISGDGNLNYIYMRYADLLLMKAEAFNETNNADSALANLNKVRQRARASYNGTPPADLLPDITTTDNTQLRDLIRKERRVEMAQEFHRYFDLMRWGKIYAEAALGVDFNYDTKRYFPLPQAEIDANQALKP